MADKKDVVYVDATKFFKVVRVMNGVVSFPKSAMEKMVEEGRPKSSAETIKALEDRIAVLESEKRRNAEDTGPRKKKPRKNSIVKNNESKQ